MDTLKIAMIVAFLKEFKRLVAESDVDIFVKRKEYQDAFVELGIAISDAYNVLMSLSIDNYCSGPEPDKDRPGTGSIWEFGTETDGKEVYIKLKIVESGDKKYAKCISFHRAKYPIDYPLKK